MSNLIKFFETIRNDKYKITGSPDGKIFEENFKYYLKRAGFNQASLNIIDDEQKSFLAKIKPKILSKNNTEILDNSLFATNTKRIEYTDFFIW